MGQGPEKIEPGSEEAQENDGGEIQERGNFYSSQAPGTSYQDRVKKGAKPHA
jgi:hypothetical protein